jgi:phospholipid N-methyltransferase
MSVGQYIEDHNVGGIGRRRIEIVSTIQNLGICGHGKTFLEIGAGTGMFLEQILDSCKPSAFEVYETNPAWRAYLKSSYPTLTCQPADGRTLTYTQTDSVDVVFAHAVFVYLPMLVTAAYFQEIQRVLKPNGFVVMDFFVDESFGPLVIDTWLSDERGYEFPVVWSKSLLLTLAEHQGWSWVNEFAVPYHSSSSTYFVFTKQSDL